MLAYRNGSRSKISRPYCHCLFHGCTLRHLWISSFHSWTVNLSPCAIRLFCFLFLRLLAPSAFRRASISLKKYPVDFQFSNALFNANKGDQPIKINTLIIHLPFEFYVDGSRVSDYLFTSEIFSYYLEFNLDEKEKNSIKLTCFDILFLSSLS